jgi:oxygen-independent coproporphyrinogen-3 oxidase
MKMKADFVEALLREIELRKEVFQGQVLSSIYFGGGTPSLLSKDEIHIIFDKLYTSFSIDKDAEITLEANPDDLTLEKILTLKETPINRLSIGIQSFRDEDLQFMNRAHNAEEALKSIKMCQEAGFKNLTIDLIYGTPGMDDEAWKENLKTTFDLNIPHISSYALTVEEKTALHTQILKKKVAPVNEQQSARQFEILIQEMESNGYEQYEISNFCKPNAFSRHNSSYWKKDLYLGFGPSAHSYMGASRLWNVANNVKYIKALQENKLPIEEEFLTLENRYNEYVMTSLRTKWGCSIHTIEQDFSPNFASHFYTEIEGYIKAGHVSEEKGIFYLTKSGKLLADRIASDLFKV